MADLGDLIVKISAQVDPFVQAMKRATDSVGKAVDQIDAKVDKLSNDLEKNLNKSSAAFAALGTAVGSFAGSLAAQAVSSITSGIAELGASIVKAGAAAEQSKVAFTTLLGSADRAQSLLGELRDFAASTPFEFPELQGAARNMLAFGFSADKVIPMLRTIGDAVSALGGGSAEIDRVTRALGQMQAKGKVSAEEMQQLAELGIPAWQLLADQIGVTIPKAMKMAEGGAIDATKAIEALLAGMQGRFAGGMEAQSKTLGGMWSNLKDQLTEIARILGEMILPTLKEIVDLIGPAVKGFGDLLAKYREWKKLQEKPLQQSQTVQSAEIDSNLAPGIEETRAAIARLNEEARQQAENYRKDIDAGVLKLRQQTQATLEETEKQKRARLKAEKEVAEHNKEIRDLELKAWRANESAVESHGKAVERATEKIIKKQNELMEALDKAAKAQRVLADHTQQTVVWQGKQAEMIDKVNQRIIDQEQAVRRGTKAIENERGAWEANKEEATAGLKKQEEISREVSTIMTDLNRGLAEAIIKWRGFRDVAMRALTEMGEAILRLIIKQLLESTHIIEKMTNAVIALVNQLLKWLNIQTQISKVPVPQTPGGPSVPAPSGGGGGGGGSTGGVGVSIGKGMASGAAGWIAAGASVVSAVSDIISNFQMARQENTLNAIEWNTRKSSIHLEYLLEKANETWPYLQHINNTLWTPGAPGGGGGTQITVNYTGDVRNLTMMIVAELQRMGLRVAPA